MQYLSKINVPILCALLLAVAVTITTFLAPSVVMPFFTGGAFAYGLHPITSRVNKRIGGEVGHRTLILMVVISSFLLFLLAILLVAPAAYNQLVTICQLIHVEKWIHIMNEQIIPKIKPYLPSSVLSLLDAEVSDLSTNLITELRGFISYVIASTSTMISVVMTIVLTPVVAYYLLCDYGKIRSAVLAPFPPQTRGSIAAVTTKLDFIMRNFIVGQTLLSLIWGMYYGIAYHLIGIEMAVALGFVAFVASFIPYLGAVLTLVISLLVIIIQFGAITSELWLAVAIYTVGHILDVALVSNYVLGRQMGLHPLLTLFSLLFSAKFFGILGMIFALPVTVTIKMFMSSWLLPHRHKR